MGFLLLSKHVDYCIIDSTKESYYINSLWKEGLLVLNDISLYSYAFCGTETGFDNMLGYLAELAEEEKWSFDETKPYSILKKYILGTFSQCYKQDKLLVSADANHSCFNTGLLTPNGNDIIALFEKNTKVGAQPWVLRKFKDKCSRDFLDVFTDTPLLATYTTNFEELYFNPDYNIVVNTDHILDDNWERIESVVKMNKALMKTLLVGVVEEAKLRIQRNLRLVVPQFYKNKIMYLVPIRIPNVDGAFETMAYEKARLLMKPESNWLVD